MSSRTFWIGLLAWLLLPTVVIGGLAGYAMLYNQAPQAGLLHCTLDSPLAFTGQQRHYQIRFDGSSLTPSQKNQPPLALILVIDVSDSVQPTLGALAEAVQDTTRMLLETRPGDVRFALLSFATSATQELDWSSDVNQLGVTLRGLQASGATNLTAIYPRIKELLNTARPGSQVVSIIYTDGKLSDEVLAQQGAEQLRRQGIEFYVVGVPNYPLPEIMDTITGDPNRVLDTANLLDLSNKLRVIGAAMIVGVGFNAQLTSRLDPRYFQVPSSPGWSYNADGSLIHFVGTLSQRERKFTHPLVSQHIGLWPVGLEVPRLRYSDVNNQFKTDVCPRRPLLLVLNGWLLVLLYGPALLWLLYWLLQRPQPEPVRRIAPPEVVAPLPPSPLPLPQPSHGLPSSPPVPSLFIGLGQAGGQALQAIEARLRQRAAAGGPGDDDQFLWLDIDARSATPPTGDTQICLAVAPSSLCRLQETLNPPLPVQLRWVPWSTYRDATREQLSVEQGAGGDRILGRLALFRWLAEGDLVALLESAVAALLRRPTADGGRQIIILASDTGGFGSGVLLDIARLLRRISRRDRRPGELVPEVIAVLLRSEAWLDDRREANRLALFQELETAKFCGLYPQHIPYTGPDARHHELLNAMDAEAPFNWIFAVGGHSEDEAAHQTAHLCAVLTDRLPRWQLLADSPEARSATVVPTAITGIYTRPYWLRNRVAGELLQYLLGPTVLADVQRGAEHTYRPWLASEQEGHEAVRHWAQQEIGAGHWAQLLRVAGEQARPAEWHTQADERQPATLDWLRQAFSMSVNRQLAGSFQGGAGQRGLPTCVAIPALHCLANRLEALLSEPAIVDLAPGDTLKTLAAEIRSVGDALHHWIDGLCPILTQADKVQVDMQQRLTQRLAGELTLDSDPAFLEHQKDGALRVWLPGVTDVAGVLQQRLHFTVIPYQQGLQLVLRTHIGQTQDFVDVAKAVEFLTSLTNQLAGLSPAMDIASVLADLNPGERQQMAQRLIQDNTLRGLTLIVAPRTTAEQDEQAVADFISYIPELAGYVPRTEIRGNDHSAVQQIQLADQDASAEAVYSVRQALVGPDSLAQWPECRTAQLRQRIEQKYRQTIPLFPPTLRLAIANTEAFQRFCQAYRQGRIVPRQDETGLRHWYSLDAHCFLTQGSDTTLAAAAAEFVARFPTLSVKPMQGGQAGDFSALVEWQRRGGLPKGQGYESDIAILAAIDVFEEVPL